LERFKLKKLNEVEGKEQYRVEISNSFAALENFKTLRCLLNYYEPKNHKPWFNEGCSEILDRRKKSQIAVVPGSKQNKWG
jgi:hypothetical protein